jgi:hypothetical protein
MRKVVRKKPKGQMNMSFGMIFAIVAGAFILALAIYAVVKFANSAEKGIEGETSKTIGILTNPLESSFESSQTITITTPVETRIYTGCYYEEQEIDYDASALGPLPVPEPTGFIGNEGEILLIDEVFMHHEDAPVKEGFKFWGESYLSQFPQDWSVYQTGRIELRFEVLSQPTNVPSNLQFGIWQRNSAGACKNEVMSSTVTLNGPGNVRTSSQTPNQWWDASTSTEHVQGGADAPVDWSDVGSFCRVGSPLWSNSNPKKLVSDIDGHDWNRRQEYMPMVVRISVVMVPQGESFSGWDDWINEIDSSQFGSFSTNDKYFGKQILTTSQMSRNKWTEPSIDVYFSNKYIFSENPSQGKKFYIFSKPFEFPYKVSDIVYILSKDVTYCFLDADTIRQGDLEEEIENMNQPNLLVDECPEESINVCFHNLPDCDISINYGAGELTKPTGEELLFTGDALMFAAIFSDKPTYECQLERLIKRAESLSEIYDQKYDIMIREIQCDSNMKIELLIFNDLLKIYTGPEILSVLARSADDLDYANEWSDCRLW